MLSSPVALTFLGVQKDISFALPQGTKPDDPTSSTFRLKSISVVCHPNILNIPKSIFRASRHSLTTLVLSSSDANRIRSLFSQLTDSRPFTTTFYSECFPFIAPNLRVLDISRLEPRHKQHLLPVLRTCTLLQQLVLCAGEIEADQQVAESIIKELGGSRLSVLELQDSPDKVPSGLLTRTTLGLLTLPVCSALKVLRVKGHSSIYWMKVAVDCQRRGVQFGA